MMIRLTPPAARAPRGSVRPADRPKPAAKPRQHPHVGIVILNWKRPEDTTACLRSLEALDYPSYEVVVVDNGAVEGSPALLRQRFPQLMLIENGRNLGFAAGSNVGIEHLLRRGADYVLLLNDDTEVAPDLLSRLVEAGEADPGLGILGPTIYYHGRPDVIWSAGGSIDPYGAARHLGADERDDRSSPAVRDVDYVTGCAMLVKREVIERIGALDERFFAYYEETEWCARARRAGFRVAHVPPVRMWHKIEPAARGNSPLYLYLMARNRLLYLKCSGAGRRRILLASVDLLRTAASSLRRREKRATIRCSGPLVHGVCDFLLGRLGVPPAYP